MSVIFAEFGIIVASWATRVASIKHSLKIGDGTLGLALLAIPIAMVIATRFSGRWAHRFGSSVLTAWAMPAMSLSLVVIGGARDLPELIAALAVFGIAMGMADTAINAHAITINGLYPRSVISSFHGYYNVGAMAGGLFGAATLRLGWATSLHLSAAAVVCALVAVALSRRLLPGSADVGDQGMGHESNRRIWTPRVIALGAIVFSTFGCESVAADWSAVYLRDNLHARPGTAAIAFTLFATTMGAMRLSGDQLTRRFNSVRIIQMSAVIAFAGMTLIIFGGSVAVVLFGWALFGTGQGVVVPVAFNAAAGATEAGTAIVVSRVIAVGYLGLMLSPPVVGGLSSVVGLRAALFVPLIFCLIYGSLAPAVGRPARESVTTAVPSSL